MTRNVGSIDRALRAIIGIVALVGALLFGWFSGWMLWAAVAVGVILLATSAMGTCPLYRLIGVNTCKI
jgi:hypothetical protein